MPASLHNNVITGDGLRVLQSIFNDWCHAHHIASNHPSAKEAAGRLLDWYQLGYHRTNAASSVDRCGLIINQLTERRNTFESVAADGPLGPKYSRYN